MYEGSGERQTSSHMLKGFSKGGLVDQVNKCPWRSVQGCITRPNIINAGTVRYQNRQKREMSLERRNLEKD